MTSHVQTGTGGGDPAEAPTCYRHQDRETWVRCTRCDRPICPDCMREASVGFHCVDCVRQSTRTVRQPRTVFGGQPRGRTDLVTWVLVAVNVVVFIAQRVFPHVAGSLGIPPGLRSGGLFSLLAMWPVGVAEGQWWRLITAAFLHAGFLHIAFNMWALIILGRPLEALLGRTRFLALYLLSAFGGSALTYLIGAPNIPSIGASGAIFGVFGATFVVARRLRLDTRWIVGLLVINLVLSFVVSNIAWQAHVGGLVVGLFLGFAYAYAPQGSRRLATHLATSAVVFVACAAIVTLLPPSILG
ncbi:MAG: rhomboid family intramembrane serine protease [Streptosporangiaceae bacterium]